MKRIRYLLEYLPLKLILFLAGLLPLAAARRFGDAVAWLLGRVLKLRREVVESNLERAFPDKSAEERTALADSCYRFYCRMALEWSQAERMLSKESVEFESAQIVEKQLERGQGIIFISGHLGYWELAGALLVRRFGPMHVYADVLHNPYVNGEVERRRRELGVETVTGKWALKKQARLLRQGKLIGLVADQSKGVRQAEVPFFDYGVKNTRIPATLARITGAPVVPVVAVREQTSTIKVRFSAPLPASLDGLDRENEEELLRQYNEWLEREVRKYPEQYFWLHRRWKKARPLAKEKD